MTSGGTTSYKVLVINHDKGMTQQSTALVNEGNRAIEAMRSMRYQNGAPMIVVEVVQDRQAANEQLKNRYAAALIVLPAGFSEALHATRSANDSESCAYTLVGDATNPMYSVASVVALTGIDIVVREVSKIKSPIGFQEEFVTQSKPRTEFEMYVPGLLILSIVMLLFTTALPLVREREDKTLRRLRLTSMTSFDLLGGVSLSQVVIGAASLVLTLLTATALGFRNEGSLGATLIIGVLTVGSVVAVGLITACFCKSATSVLTIGTLPFFLIMWFTGAAMPMPRATLFEIGTRQIALNDILPPTHSVIALNKILSFGATLSDVWFELLMLTGLTLVYFVVGVVVFQKTQMRKQ
jgi:ABC-2 type transport system permease protein